MTAPDPFPAPAVTPERELTAPVSLTLANGRLNPAASGFARSPLVDTSGIGGRHGWLQQALGVLNVTSRPPTSWR
ncbi:hypothetical protein [Pseudoxanthomonas mexicana]